METQTILILLFVVATAVAIAMQRLAVSQVIKQVDDPMIEITLTTIAAYGSFLAAEHFNFSGVTATVAAGMLCGNYGARVGMSPISWTQHLGIGSLIS